ncbi:MAG: hypothetical protein H6981_08450 [Gammaproteobacteria bacterium]|nr:hypothetical protein [Gammaproteobacteria bacterium]MCP5136817.1 hypothetical protein [Gammaproteobacteria bacterium]
MNRFDRVESWFASRGFAILVLAGLLAFAGWNRFVQDDAFISFRYAQHLIEGHGLVWNVGEAQPIEGYTNFLWVMLIAIGFVLGLEPDTWSLVLGFACGLGTLLTTYRLARTITGRHDYAVLGVFLMGMNYSFSAYITGGLETQLQAFLVVLSYAVAFRLEDRLKAGAGIVPHALGLSVLLALAAMTRLDSVLLAGPAWLFAVGVVWGHRGTPMTGNAVVGRVLSALVLPGLLMGVGWFAFKWSFYGDLLPNTFYVKAGAFRIESLVAGVWYVWGFLFYYGLLLPAVILLLRYRTLLAGARERLLFGAVLLWSLYLIKIGGDFMEYRQIVPMLPLVFVLIASVFHSITDMLVRVGLVISLLLSSATHAETHWGFRGIEAIDELRAHVYEVGFDRGWQLVGKTLHELFRDAESPVVIATTAAGAIPYYSELPTVDMLGLNDRYIAREGMHIDAFAGHGRYATLDYLLERNVNLVIGHPKVVPLKHTYKYTAEQMFHTTYFSEDFDLSSLPESARVVDIKIADNRKVVVLYLKPSPAIDRVIAAHGYRVYKPKLKLLR